MAKTISKELDKHKEYVKKRLAELTPVLQKAAVGDFVGKIKIPEKEDEFSELLVGLSLMMDDLQELQKIREKSEREAGERMGELEQWRRLTTGREIKMTKLKDEIKSLKSEIEKLKEQLYKTN